MASKPTTYINLDAGHDRNGNPRRVWVMFDSYGNILNTVNEGYHGDPFHGQESPPTFLGQFATTLAQYRALLKRSTG